MNWEAIGAVGEIVASIAVLLTLLYLSIQVRYIKYQNRAFEKESSFRTAIQMHIETATNNGLSDLLLKARLDDELTPSESIRYQNYIGAYALMSQSVYLAYKEGIYSELEWESYKGITVQAFGISETSRQFFLAYTQNVNPDLGREIEDLFADA